MKITLLTPDASRGILPRTRLLYKLLEKDFELEVISIVKKRDKTEHFKEEFPNFKKVNFNLGTIIEDLNKTITGDLIYALKAKPSSFGMAMSLKSKKNLPVIIDIDAREIYNCYPKSENMLKNFIFSVPMFNNPNSFTYTWLLEKRIKFADNITVASAALQKIFGGTLIPGACDPDFFNPENYKRDEIRQFMGWEKAKVILIAGNVEPGTGLEDLSEAIRRLGRPEIKLVVAGEKKPYLEKLARNNPFIALEGFQPQLNVAKLLCASDLVVLPQRNTPEERGRVPLRLFEAMAAAKPVIATDVSDFPEILAGCGLISKENDPDSLKANIAKVLDDPETARELAEKARQKCIDKYSYEKVSRKLSEFLKKYRKNES
jgi:glycosyltransferase involved in cell wall biosynthesis